MRVRHDPRVGRLGGAVALRRVLVATGLLVGMLLAGAAPAGAAAGGPGPTVTGANVLMGNSHGTSNSLDWAGYAVTGTSLTSASGSWTQPSATCSAKKPTQSAFWVGIDGYAATDPTVQQIGTDADCTKGTKKVPSAPSYYAWYELYPDGIVTIDTATHPVAPGDTFDASVSGSGSSYTLTLTDVGRWTYSTVQTTPMGTTGASAEWIAEAPTACKSKCKAVNLTDFGTVGFTGASVNGAAISSTTTGLQHVTMTKNKKGTIVKASTSALLGSDFIVSWVSP